MHLMFSDSEQRLGMMMKQQKDDKIKRNVTEARICMVSEYEICGVGKNHSTVYDL